MRVEIERHVKASSKLECFISNVVFLIYNYIKVHLLDGHSWEQLSTSQNKLEHNIN